MNLLQRVIKNFAKIALFHRLINVSVLGNYEKNLTCRKNSYHVRINATNDLLDPC